MPAFPSNSSSPHPVPPPSPRRLSRWLFAANILGVFLYLFLASPSWPVSSAGVASSHATVAEPSSWARQALPILVLFVLIDGVWAGVVLVKKQQKRVPLLLAVLAWCAAVAIDFAHH